MAGKWCSQNSDPILLAPDKMFFPVVLQQTNQSIVLLHQKTFWTSFGWGLYFPSALSLLPAVLAQSC